MKTKGDQPKLSACESDRGWLGGKDNGRVNPTKRRDEYDYLLYDGACGMCRRAVALLVSRDRYHRIKAIPFQEAHRVLHSPPFTPELRAACEREML